MKILCCCFAVLFCFVSTSVYAGEYGSWQNLDAYGKISWRGKCGTSANEWKFQFRNNTSTGICVDYTINNGGWGSQAKYVPAHSTKGTYANYTGESCADGISINSKVKEERCY